MSTQKTPEEMRNILDNLNQLESYLFPRLSDESIFEDVSTYFRFLEQHFIKKNDLAKLYFQQIPQDIMDAQAYWKEFVHLDDVYAIISGLDICVYKQFNFPNCKPHSSGCFECIYIMQGSGTLRLSDQSYSLHEGDCIFHQPDETYLLNTDPNSIALNIELRTGYTYDFWNSLFSDCPPAQYFFKSYCDKELSHNSLLFHTDNSREFQDVALHMLGEMLAERPYKNEILKHYFELFVFYLKRCCGVNAKTVGRLSSQELYYHEIMQYLKDNYRTADLESTAARFHLSKNYVSRIMRSVSDRTFIESLSLVRIEKVKEYLAETELSLEIIAELTGVSDPSYLWRVFKKHTGMSPSKYRKAAMPGTVRK